jgi:hypothetical protein
VRRNGRARPWSSRARLVLDAAGDAAVGVTSMPARLSFVY